MVNWIVPFTANVFGKGNDLTCKHSAITAIIYGYEKGGILVMQKRHHIGILLVIVVLLSSTPSLADTKPIPELIKNATGDLFPSFRLAAARALVAALLVTGETNLDGLLQQQRSQGAFFLDELALAINEAKDGIVVDVCISEQAPPLPFQGVNLAGLSEDELKRLTLTGFTSELKREAARELLRRLLNLIATGAEYPADAILRAIENIEKPFDSLFELRVFNKRHEDFVFDELKVDMLGFTTGANPAKVELIEEAGVILAKVFYAEFLVTLDRNFVRTNAGCEQDDS